MESWVGFVGHGRPSNSVVALSEYEERGFFFFGASWNLVLVFS